MPASVWSRIAPRVGTVLHGARNKLVLTQLRARLRRVETQIKQIDAELQRLIADDPDLAHRFGILVSIPGIDPVAALAMIVEMPEPGSMDGKQAACLTGLAPITRESGKRKGKSRIGGGRHSSRRALYTLYMPLRSQFGTTGSLGKSARRSAAQENPPKSLSRPSCASSCSSQTP